MNSYFKNLRTSTIISMITMASVSYAQKTNTPSQNESINSKTTTLDKKINSKELKFHLPIKFDLNCDGIMDSIIASTEGKVFHYIKTSAGYKLLDINTMCLEDDTKLSKESYYKKK